jgi:hypothetical protein
MKMIKYTIMKFEKLITWKKNYTTSHMYIYIYIDMLFITLGDGSIGPSPRLANRSIDRARGGCPNPTCAYAGRSPHTPAWARLTPPTWAETNPALANATLHGSTISWFAQSFLIKRQLIFGFDQLFCYNIAKMLSHSCYSAQPSLLQCSVILVNSVIPCCYSIQPFFTELQCSSIYSAKVLNHFSLSYSAQPFQWTQSFLMLYYSVIFHWATLLSHFPLLRCLTICKWLQWTQSFCYNA